MLVAVQVSERGYNIEVYDTEALCRLREYSKFVSSMPSDLAFLAYDALSDPRVHILVPRRSEVLAGD